jgi:hypothetical protein
MKPWHGQLCSEWFAAGSSARMETIAAKLGKTVSACQLALKSDECQAELARYQGAVRQHLVARRVAPLEKLAAQGEAAADMLVAAMELARDRENIREMIHAAVEILAHLGMGPLKRTAKSVTHTIDGIQDPAMLAHIIETGELPGEMILGDSKSS